jgi:ubiquinone biosynthesis protein
LPANVIERVRNAARINQVLRVALRYGFHAIVAQAQEARRGLFRRVWPSTPADPAVARLTTGERLRRMLEELGPTFVKLGQLLSTRPDLIPPWAAEELVKLQDHVAPLPIEQVRATIESELSAPLDQLFAQFDETPLGTASLGQVHRAVLRNGDVVAVKVQRPGIERVIDRDLSVLSDLAEMLEGRLRWTRHISLTRVVENLSEYMRDELVYTIEGRNAERMTQALDPDDLVRIPKVYWKLTTSRVLTCEMFEAAKLTDADQPPPELRSPLAHRLARVVLNQILIEGFFHADPHPGNLMVFPDGALGIIDWGQCGLLPRQLRESLDEIFIALAMRDSERLTEEIAHLGLAAEDADLDGFRYDLSRALDRFFHLGRSDYPLSSVLRKILELSYEHAIQLPNEVPMLIKVLATTEGTCLTLDPEFDLRGEFEPLARRLVGAQLDPARLARGLLSNSRQLTRLAGAAPRQVGAILDRLESGTMQFRINSDVEEPSRHLGRMLNRLSLSLIVSGLMVAGALAMPHSHTLGMASFSAGLFAAVLVLYSILRNERL